MTAARRRWIVDYVSADASMQLRSQIDADTWRRSVVVADQHGAAYGNDMVEFFHVDVEGAERLVLAIPFGLVTSIRDLDAAPD